MTDINDTIHDLERQIAFTRRRMKPLQDQMHSLCKDLAAAKETRDALFSPTLGLKALLDNGASHTLARLKELDKRFASIYGLSNSGYWIETGQTVIRIMAYKGRPNEAKKILASMIDVLPVITPHPDGTRWFSIFEHNLSSRGSYSLRVADDQTAIVYRNRFPEYREPKSLADAIAYIVDRHYYERVDAQGKTIYLEDEDD